MSAPAAETGIKFMDRNPPTFSEDEARRIAAKIFGLDGDFSPLASERDQNFRIAAGEQDYVLKFANAEEKPGVVDFQTRALEHIERQDANLPVPRVVRTKTDTVTEWVEDARGARHMVRVLTYLSGTILDEAEFSNGLLRDFGASMARLDRALRGFFHPDARNPHPWDLRTAPEMRLHTRHIEDPSIRCYVEAVLDHFADVILPGLGALRHQVIHADAHAANILVDADQAHVCGILDFGDMHFAPLVDELAIMADVTSNREVDHTEMLAQAATGYDSVLSLEEDEVDILYDLVLTRLALGSVVIAWRKAETPDQPAYLLELEPAQWSEIDKLMTVGREEVRDRIRRALCFPPFCPMGDQSTAEATDVPDLLARRHNALGKSLYLFYDNPVHVERGRGPWLYDANGRAMLDGYNNVPTVGHSHPHVAKAIARQAASLATNTRYLYRNIIEYAERLADTFPGDLGACLFVNSGSEANDVAWRMSCMLSGHRGGIIIECAYHGMTEAIAALSPYDPEGPFAPHARALISPDPYRGPYRAGEPDLAEKYAADTDRAIAELDEAGYGTACFLVDSSFCSMGIPDVPDGYLPAVAEKVRAAGGVIIGDEVQFGFGRPGTHMWGFEAHGVMPDIVTLGKPVGNGFPLGVVVTTPDILRQFGEETHLFSTFGGNPVACAAGMAVLDVIEEEGLMEKARITGEHMREGLRGLMNKHALIGDVRGKGLIAGVEIVKDRETLEPGPDEMKRILNRMRALGVLVGREGKFGNVFKIRPSLAFGPEHADIMVDSMDRALSEM